MIRRKKKVVTDGEPAEQLLTVVPKANKIRNAQKIEQDGIKFASRLELYMYNALKTADIPFVFQKTFVLQKSFRYHGKHIRDLRIIFDFFLPEHNILADSKGFQLEDNRIKHKLLKYRLVQKYGDRAPEIITPSNQKQVNELIAKLTWKP